MDVRVMRVISLSRKNGYWCCRGMKDQNARCGRILSTCSLGLAGR